MFSIENILRPLHLRSMTVGKLPKPSGQEWRGSERSARAAGFCVAELFHDDESRKEVEQMEAVML